MYLGSHTREDPPWANMTTSLTGSKSATTLIDDFEPLQAGSRRVMEFDGSEWRDITPKIIRETRSRIEEMEFLVRIYQLRNEHPPNLDSSSSEQKKDSSS